MNVQVCSQVLNLRDFVCSDGLITTALPSVPWKLPRFLPSTEERPRNTAVPSVSPLFKKFDTNCNT